MIGVIYTSRTRVYGDDSSRVVIRIGELTREIIDDEV